LSFGAESETGASPDRFLMNLVPPRIFLECAFRRTGRDLVVWEKTEPTPDGAGTRL